MATRPRLTKSRSRDVPLYSIESRSGLLRHGFERTPRISVITDAADVSLIPHEIRDIAGDERRFIRGFPKWLKSRGHSDAALAWLAGERLLEGTVGGLLKLLHSQNRRSFVVVNTPCVEDVPFLTIQPRVFANSASIDHWSFRIRIESPGAIATWTMVDADRPPEPWVKVVEAISAEGTTRGSGTELLLRLWETRDKLPEIIAALVLRDLVAAMLLHREAANARKFLDAGVKLYPAYAELHYLAALLAIREHRFGEALPLLERTKECNARFPGSGGEKTYRSDWLLGILATHVGNVRVAFQHFLAGVKHTPLFEPSFTEILKLRLPRSVIESHQHVFSGAARRNPSVVSRVSEYLSIHGVIDVEHRIPRTARLDPVRRASLENSAAISSTSLRAIAQPALNQRSRSDSKKALGVVFEGPFFEYTSLGRVNREIARALLSISDFELRLETSAAPAYSQHLIPGANVLTPAVHKRLHQTDLTIRHQWPPNFRRPPTGKLAVILPWEYGGVPQAWIEQIRRNVDELWVPSNFVREVFVRNGVDAESVTVIPNGFDPEIFNPQGMSLRPQGCRDFSFLFVGGAIRRKGVDLLLDAYKSAFTADDSVTLVLLISGSTGAYQHNSLLADIRAATADPTYPHILPIFETVDDLVLANLYRGADAFVLPYRGEGFGMPLLEAMACAKPVITTAEGPAKDFCYESNSYLVPAKTELVTEPPPPLGPIAGPFTWFEPDFGRLLQTLRHVRENRQEATANGHAAAKSVRHLTWENATKQYADRVQLLCDP
jgi:glycosyltransferase involved in cell wall biosynthesis